MYVFFCAKTITLTLQIYTFILFIVVGTSIDKNFLVLLERCKLKSKIPPVPTYSEVAQVARST